MTREEFNDAVLNILLNQKFGNVGILFNTEDMSRYKIVQYDESDWYDESAMPLDDFLDELYEVMKNE
jgi:hypothetical protein